MTTPALAPLGASALPLIRPPGATMADQIAPFLGWFIAIRGRQPNTIDSYGRDLRAFAAFAESYGVTRPSEITFQLVEMYMAHRRHRDGCKATTVNRARHALGTFFKFLCREGIATRNPIADTFALPKPQRGLLSEGGRPKYLTCSEQEHVLNALASRTTLAGRRDYALVACGLFTGPRVSELANARVDDLDLDSGVLRVPRAKGGKQRECVVVPRLQVILRDYLARTWPALVGGRRGSPYLFTRVGNQAARRKCHEPLKTRAIWWILHRQVSPLVGRPVYPHMLRHSFASRLRENGAPLELIQEALGHAEIGTTLIYAHVSTKKVRADIARYLEEEPNGSTR